MLNIIIEYYLKRKLHREDGPAIIYSNSDMYYVINDCTITEEVNEYIKDNNWNNSHKLLFKLTLGIKWIF